MFVSFAHYLHVKLQFLSCHHSLKEKHLYPVMQLLSTYEDSIFFEVSVFEALVSPTDHYL